MCVEDNKKCPVGTDMTVVVLKEGLHSVRRVVSDQDLTMEQIGEYLSDDCDYIAVIMETPEPEEYESPNVDIVVHVAESSVDGVLFLACTKNGVRSYYKQLAQKVGRECFWEIIKSVQNGGDIDKVTSGRYWETIGGQQLDCIQYSATGIVINFEKMSSDLRVQLGF